MLVKFRPVRSSVIRDPFLDNFFSVRFPVADTVNFEPKIDIKENDKTFVIEAELPGLSKDDFKVTLENGILTLEGEKKYEHEERKDGLYRAERQYGSFKRTFRLTEDVDTKKIQADYDKGVLRITLPRAAKARPKEIEVKVS